MLSVISLKFHVYFNLNFFVFFFCITAARYGCTPFYQIAKVKRGNEVEVSSRDAVQDKTSPTCIDISRPYDIAFQGGFKLSNTSQDMQ